MALSLLARGPFEPADPLDSYERPSDRARPRRIYVAHTRAREVSILDLETLERVGVLIVGYGVDCLAYSGL